MYKFNRNAQITFSDFNQPLGMKMNANNQKVNCTLPDEMADTAARVGINPSIIQG